MTSSLGAIYNDRRKYKFLCKYYNEEPQHSLDPYCNHAKEL